jgi:hypothetical protein
METKDDCKESFRVKITQKTGDHFVEYRNGKYETIPGTLDMSISVKEAQHVYQDIINLLTPFRAIKDVREIRLEKFDQIIKALNLEENIGASITFDDRINKLQHKLESLKYHMNECSTYENKYEDKYRDKYVNSIVDLEQVDPVFVYETESFLFQTKSTLDILAQIVGVAYRLTGMVTYGDDGEKLVEKLRKSSAHRNYLEQKEEIIEMIENNENWVKKLV